MEKTIQLFKDAIAGEVTASAFYSLASEVTRDDETRMVFLSLSSMEDDHAQDLVNRFKAASGVPDFDLQAYLDALIKEDSGVDVETTSTIRNGTPQEVLNLAISLENAAKETYKKLADEAIDPDLKQYCMDLAKEEEQHASELTKTLDSLNMDSSDRPGL
ncbi:MAG: ferritin family protein [Magnetococcales bacterium]|nr:ferritin family protein [Magnetococcales bacterium]